MKIMLMGET